MADSKKFFKLAPGKQVFWDITQPIEENRKLLAGESKELEMTKNVESARRGEFILPSSADEFSKKKKEDAK